MSSNRINRREALERTSALIGGALTASVWTGVLAGCQAPKELDWIPKFMTREELVIIKYIVDILIPPTDTPCASEAWVHRFIDEMLSSYFEANDQNIVRQGLSDLQQLKFKEMNDSERIQLIQELAAKHASLDSSISYFKIIRSMTLLGYFTSEVGATQTLTHDPVPGDYEGCIPLNKYGGKTWSQS